MMIEDDDRARDAQEFFAFDPGRYVGVHHDDHRVGAGRFQRIMHVTLPGIRSTIGLLFIMGVGGLLSSGFQQMWLLRTPGNMTVADTLDVYVVRIGLQQGQFGYASAIGLVQGVVGLVLVVTTNTLSKKFTEVGLW